MSTPPPTPETPVCPQCGAPLAPDSPGGLCPRCLMAVNMAEPTNLTGETTQPMPAPALTPEEIAPFFPQLEIIEFLGRGGMGAVYKARQPRLDRLVALKILAPEREQDPAFAGRFEKEAQALARLSHPNIVTIHDFGETNGMYYLLMEYVDGVTLRQLLEAGRVSPREALAIVPQICDALQFAHDRGIVHRDIKPENLLMDRLGRVKVADFGLAKLVAGDAPDFSVDADAGKVLGTPSYMAPEQTEDPGAVDHRADIYALGVVFYQMLTGELPGQRLEAPSSKVRIDVRLDEVVLRALAANPEMRYQQASLLKTQLETIAGDPVEPARSLPAGPGVAAAPVAAKPRLSRLAILGACLIALSVCMLPPVLLIGLFVGEKVRTSSAYELQRGLPLFEQQQMRHTGTVPNFAPVFPGPAPVSSGGISVIGLLIVLGLLGLLMPATILGWVAVVQIRRSGGAIYGMGLALFDGLFFPLLVLGGLPLVWAFVRVTHQGMIPVFSILLVPAFVAGIALVAILWATRKTPAADARKRRRWISWLLTVLGMSLIGLNLFERWKNQEQEHVWVTNNIDTSVSGKFGEALLHVTNVNQAGPVVLITVACDTPFADGGLHVQYSGQIINFPPAAAVALAGPVDCLMTPRFMSRDDSSELLEGDSLLKGKRIYKIGFVLPDVLTATKTVQQVQDVHLGKPRGLDQKAPSLLLFSLHQLVGQKPDGQPYREGLDAMLIWYRQAPYTVHPTPASANNSFGPSTECTLPMDASGMTPLFNPDQNQPVPGVMPGDSAEKMAALGIPGIAVRHDVLGHEIFLYGMSGALVAYAPVAPGPGDPWERVAPYQAFTALSGDTMHPGGNISIWSIDDLPQIFYFKSGAGLLGALQITGFGTNANPGLKLRYKMAPPSAWQDQANPAPPSAGPAFGPASEFALPMDQTGLTQLFDLDLAQPAPGAMPGDTPDKMAARGHPGIAVRHDVASHKIVLYGMSGSMVSGAIPPSGDLWERPASPQTFTALLKNTMSPGGYVSVEATDDLPQTFYFKSGAGLLGVLQITGLSGSNGPPRNQPCLYLRYKMVMPAAWRPTD